MHVPESGKAYVVECGFLTPEGKFLLAVRSNVVNVPRFGLSSVRDKDWTAENSDELIGLSAEGLKRPLGASEKRFGAAAERSGGLGGLPGHGSGSGMFGAPSSRG